MIWNDNEMFVSGDGQGSLGKCCDVNMTVGSEVLELFSDREQRGHHYRKQKELLDLEK